MAEQMNEVKFYKWYYKPRGRYNGDGILEQYNHHMDELRNLIFVSIISADNDELGLTEDQKQEIIQRHKMNMSWESILEPIPNEDKRNKLIHFFEESDID